MTLSDILMVILIILIIILLYMLSQIFSHVYVDTNVGVNILRDNDRLRSLMRQFIPRAVPVHVPVYGDSQNVHDVNVNSKYKNKIRRLTELNGDWISPGEEEAVYRQTELEILNLSDVERVLRRIRSDAHISDIKYGEKRILMEVWHRAHVYGNNVEILEEAIINSLKDMIDEHGMILCTTGRIHRIIDSFVNGDIDEQLREPIPTIAILKLEVNSKIAKLIEDELEANEKLATDFNLGRDTKLVEDMKEHVRGGLLEYLAEYNLDKKTTDMFLGYIDTAF